jgi:uncharacterized membrane protein
MSDPLQSFRQPMVTATGVMLGFILSYLANWAKAEVPRGVLLAVITGICLFVGTGLLILCLFRMLQLDYPRPSADRYYNITLWCFIVGIILAFVGVFVDMSAEFMLS